MTTYTEAKAYLNGKVTRPLEYATRLIERDPSTITVHHHSTDIVTYHKSGTVELNTGGWHTPTTKDRLNRYTGLNIYQKARVWYVNGPDKGFLDGMTVEPNGTLTGYAALSQSTEKTNRTWKRKVSRYCDDYIESLFNGKVPAPGPGDCWYCAMVTTEGVSLGQAAKDDEHIRQHIEERYYVPSMLANAIKRFPVSTVALWTLSNLWGGGETIGDSLSAIARDQLRKALYRFILEQIGFAS